MLHATHDISSLDTCYWAKQHLRMFSDNVNPAVTHLDHYRLLLQMVSISTILRCVWQLLEKINLRVVLVQIASENNRKIVDIPLLLRFQKRFPEL